MNEKPGGPAAAGHPEAGLVVRAGQIHTMLPGLGAQRAVAVRDDRVMAVSADPHGVDEWITDGTVVLDEPDGTVLPAFDDTHTHLIFAGHGAFDVPVHEARNLEQFLDLIRQRAALTPEGEWIRTTTNWQELNLAERRMPTVEELDAATRRHPVLVKRGGHNDVLNSPALRLAGITEDTPDPPGGLIGRDDRGKLTGRLIDRAIHLVEHLVPPPGTAQRIEGLRQASADYAASGIGTVRDCAVPLDDLPVLRAAHDAGALNVRVRALVSAMGRSSPEEVEELLDGMEEWRYPRDAWLTVWGVKFVLDGGLEGAATELPYAGHDDFCGLVLWQPDALAEAVERVVRRGWRVGTHAFGDRAVRTLLDIYERVLDRVPGLPANSLVMEHGGLADEEQRARAARLGIPVTIQQPLLHDTAEVALGSWGAERVARLFPARQWIDQGVLVTAGSDFPVGGFGAMRSVWGLTTRQTVAGVRGPEHAVSVPEAVALHTVNAARFLGESGRRGSISLGRLADLTIWPANPLSSPPDDLRDLMPSHTVVGGRLVARP